MSESGMRRESKPENIVEIQAAEIRTQLRRILSARIFEQSSRLRRFLTLIVEGAVERKGGLNEYSIGVDVFDKGEQFDPRIDPIVRVQVRRLRSKLKLYYETEGAKDPIQIELPPRTYSPVICRRPTHALRAEVTGTPETSVAVLPFVALSTSREHEHFATGLTQELIHGLFRVEGLRIVFLGADPSHAATRVGRQQLGSRFNVQALLEGTVRATDKHVRISARLIRVADGVVLWSEVYEIDVVDLVSTQEQIGRSICHALNLRVDKPGTRSAPGDPAAYELYLKGRYLCDKRTREGLQKCLVYLKRAVAAYPGFAPAHEGLAEAYTLMATEGEFPPGEVMPAAKAEALRAIEIEPALAEAYAHLGAFAALYDFDGPASESQFERCLELAPNSPRVRRLFSDCVLIPSGRFDQARAHLNRARELDPLCLSVHNSLAYASYVTGALEEAAELLQEAIDLEPGSALCHHTLGLVYAQLGDYVSAIRECGSSLRLGDRLASYVAGLAYAFALAGKLAEARVNLGELTSPARRYVPAAEVASVHVGLGAYDAAIASLEKAYTERCASLPRLMVDPRMTPLRSDERFHAIMAKMRF